MKLTTSILIVTFAFFLTLLAQAEPPPRPNGPPPGGPGSAEMAKLAESLHLTPEQRAKYDAANAETSKRFRDIHEGKVNNTLTHDEVLKQALETHKSLTAKMKEILTPEQFAIWEPAREANHRRVIERDKQREAQQSPAPAK